MTKVSEFMAGYYFGVTFMCLFWLLTDWRADQFRGQPLGGLLTVAAFITWDRVSARVRKRRAK